MGRIKFRAVTLPGDEEFLQKLYFSVRDDLASVLPDPNLLQQMLLMQYRAQTLTYEREFPDASHEIILLDGDSVGRVLVERRPDVVTLVDVSLLPGARNTGIGTAVLGRLFEECDNGERALMLHVVKTNRAKNLYDRLGFTVVGDNGTHFLMRREARGENRTED